MFTSVLNDCRLQPEMGNSAELADISVTTTAAL